MRLEKIIKQSRTKETKLNNLKLQPKICLTIVRRGSEDPFNEGILISGANENIIIVVKLVFCNRNIFWHCPSLQIGT